MQKRRKKFRKYPKQEEKIKNQKKALGPNKKDSQKRKNL